MKKVLLIVGVALLLFGCRAHYPVAQETGLDDVAYLLFVSGDEYAGKTVDVTIDSNTAFEAKVVKLKKAQRRGTQYGISTGRHTIKVARNGTTVYQKEIFVSTQEVKQIILP